MDASPGLYCFQDHSSSFSAVKQSRMCFRISPTVLLLLSTAVVVEMTIRPLTNLVSSSSKDLYQV